MVYKASQRFSAMLCCLCVIGLPAFADDPSGSLGSSYGASTPILPQGPDRSVGPDLRIEIIAEKLDATVAAHRKVVKELSAVLEERDAFGTPTVRAHLAAKTLIELENRTVLPFLAHNIAYSVPLPFAFTAQPILEGCPYLSPLMRFELSGARAIIEAVARRPENGISDREWKLYGYVLVNIFGDDERGRNAAIALIDKMEPQFRKTTNLEVLRERVRSAKKVLYR